MRHIKPYVNSNNSISLTLEESFSRDIKILNGIEDLLPTSLTNEFHLDMCFDKGIKAIVEYHKSFLNANSTLIKESKSWFSQSEINELKESVKLLINKLESSRINEEMAIPTDASQLQDKDWDNVMANISSTTDLSGIDTSGSGILGMLKSLLSALTEGGSAIGILHFVLDIVGLVGDGLMAVTGIPLGIIADLLNGIIYMVRAVNGDDSKYLLAIISFIAAAIPLGGDVIKGLAKGTKAGKEMMEVSVAYYSKAAVKQAKATGKTAVPYASKFGSKMSPEAVELVSKASPEGVKGLEYVSKSSKKALPLIRDMIAKFFDGFLATVTGWIPFIGKPLKRFFTSIGKMFRGFSKDAAKFADDIPKVIKEADLLKVDNFFDVASFAGAKITAEGKDLVVKYKGRVEKLPANLLTSNNVFKKRFGGVMTENIDDMIKASNMNITSFYESIAKNLQYYNKSVYGKALKIGKIVIAAKRSWMIFLGKEIYKLVTGMDPLKMGISDSELEAQGISSFQKMADDIKRQEMAKNHKVKFPVPIIDSDNDEHAKVWQGVQNSYAEQMGLPSIESVVYYKNKEKDKMPEDLKKFMEASLEDRMDAINKMEGMDLFSGSEKSYSRLDKKNESFIHIVPFTDFLLTKKS